MAEAYSEFSKYTQLRQEVAYQMVDNAIAAFEKDKDSAFADIQNPDHLLYHDDDLYVFVTDDNGVIVAHGATPELVGVDTHDLIDDKGVNIGDLFDAHRSGHGSWVKYHWPNPATATDKGELKLSWARVYQGYTFYVGVYPEYSDQIQVYLDDADRQRHRLAQSMADQALEDIIADKDSAFANIQDKDNPLYHDDDLYVFVLDSDGVIIAHGATPNLVGTNTHNLIDIRYTNIGELIEANRSPYGKWVEYYWPNPATETDERERKLTWIKYSAGYTVAVGIYPDAPGAHKDAPISEYDKDRQEVVWDMVNDAIESFNIDMAGTMAEIQDPENDRYHDNDIYLSVLDKNGVIIAHGVSPDAVGVDTHDLVDIHGTNLGELFVSNYSPYGKWVEYYWPNAATESDEAEFKMALLVTVGEYVIGGGIHPHAMEDP